MVFQTKFQDGNLTDCKIYAIKSLCPKLVWINNYIIRLEFNGGYLNKDKAPFTPNNVVGLFIFYELNTWSKDLNAEFTLKDYLKIVWKCYNNKKC